MHNSGVSRRGIERAQVFGSLENGIRCSKLRVRVVQSLAWAGRRIVGPS
jgi:hypothetical protein